MKLTPDVEWTLGSDDDMVETIGDEFEVAKI